MIDVIFSSISSLIKCLQPNIFLNLNLEVIKNKPDTAVHCHDTKMKLRIPRFTVHTTIALSKFFMGNAYDDKDFLRGWRNSNVERSLIVQEQPACPVRSNRRGLQASIYDGVVISNGLIKLGVTRSGALNVDVPGDSHYNVVGLRYIFPDLTEGDSTSYGCLCEGWGAGADGIPIFFNRAGGSSSYLAGSDVFSSTPTTAISNITSSDERLRVTHDYHPSASTPNLYEVIVTLENIGTTPINELLYRRNMDWDIFPTEFAECVTIQPNPSTVVFLETADNNGFSSSNPYVGSVGSAPLDTPAPFTDLGPFDHGATFNFKFNALDPGSSFSFKTYYGAGVNQEEAEGALSSVAAEAYSFGKPNVGGACTNSSRVFIFVS